MSLLSPILFSLILVLVAGFSFRCYKRIWDNIHLGKRGESQLNRSLSWKRVFLVAFGQKKMFKKWIPAVLHLFIYVAFLFTQIELVEIIIDGVSGSHRSFSGLLGSAYPVLINSIEILSFFALISTLIFLVRRNLLVIPRLRKSELNGWPKLDANLILIGELVLVCAIFLMNGADQILQARGVSAYPSSGELILSSLFTGSFLTNLQTGTLVLIERSGWWIHVLTVFAFIAYLPFSKHLHIALAFPNVFHARQGSSAKMENIPVITNEIKSMMGLIPESTQDEIPDFGANDIFGLSQRTLLAAYSCTECGRCTDECPANITDKVLSPRKIMMDIRDRCEEVGAKIADGAEAQDYNDGKDLWSYISKEEIHACTSCQACVEACPIMIDPLEPILELRRYEILTDAKGPSDWLPMFTSIENSGSAWQLEANRLDWADE